MTTITFGHKTTRKYFADVMKGTKRRHEVRLQRKRGVCQRYHYGKIWRADDQGTPQVQEVEDWCAEHLHTQHEVHHFHEFCRGMPAGTDYIAVVFDSAPTKAENVHLKLRFG